MKVETRINKFKRWLHANGAEILEPTNEYEAIRFVCKHGTGVLYLNKKGKMSFSHPFVEQALNAHLKNNSTWDGKGERVTARNHGSQKAALFKRDGCRCFYCQREFSINELTQEHLLSAVHGGPNRIENKVLACQPCNQKAGNKSLIEKIRMRESFATIN